MTLPSETRTKPLDVKIHVSTGAATDFALSGTGTPARALVSPLLAARSAPGGIDSASHENSLIRLAKNRAGKRARATAGATSSSSEDPDDSAE